MAALGRGGRTGAGRAFVGLSSGKLIGLSGCGQVDWSWGPCGFQHKLHCSTNSN